MSSKPDNANELHDISTADEEFLADAVEGLSSKPQKTMPAKYLYDKRGSELFDDICELDAYYPTRTELGIMKQHAGDMADAIGPQALLVEYGSGSSMKTSTLLHALNQLTGYVPMDISGEHLEEAAQRIAIEFPNLPVYPVCADFTQPFDLPTIEGMVRRRVAYFPGSTIGNFTKEQAVSVLTHICELMGAGGGLLIGVDLEKDPDVLKRAYDDDQGVTAEFNLNLLDRMNRELDANFDRDAFEHEAKYNEEKRRIEMHLVTDKPQKVRLDHTEIEFSPGESIHTENSHKFTEDSFAELAAQAGFKLVKVWKDDRAYFSVMYLEVA